MFLANIIIANNCFQCFIPMRRSIHGVIQYTALHCVIFCNYSLYSGFVSLLTDLPEAVFLYFWFKYDLGRCTMHPKFDPTGVRTHDLQITTVHFMSLKMPALTTWPSLTSFLSRLSKLPNQYHLQSEPGNFGNPDINKETQPELPWLWPLAEHCWATQETPTVYKKIPLRYCHLIHHNKKSI